MTTTAREFMRNFRLHRARAACGKTVRVIAPDGVYLFTREKSAKTCGTVLAGLAEYAGRGFLTADGAQALEAGTPLVTRNVRHFREIRGLKVIAH